MEATALSVGKSVLDGALSYAKSALAEEVALQLGVRRDQIFITNELEMMQAFLEAAHGEGDDNKDMVVKVWVKQVRDVAYDVEDCLLDFAVRLDKQPWWRNLLDRRHVAKQMKELRANVEDVSQRNLRYNLITKGSKPSEQSAGAAATTATTMSGTDEARRQREEANLALVELISDNDKDRRLRVISVWGKGCTGDLTQASVVRRAYDYVKIQCKFECQAFIQIQPMEDFSLTQFMQDVVQQFYTNCLQRGGESGEEGAAPLRAQLLKMMGVTTEDDLRRELEAFLSEKRYLVVLNGISRIDEWERVKPCFPDYQMGSRILVSAHQVGVASLCVGAENGAPDYKHLFADQTLHVFYNKSSHHGKEPMEAPSSSSNAASTAGDSNSSNTKMFNRMQTMLAALKESELIGRDKEKTDIINLITSKDDEHQQREVITVWGMGGIGKTTLVREVYQSQELIHRFERRACVTILRPFNPNELLRNLATQLGCENSDKDEMIKHLEDTKYLIVLDDLLSNTEWDTIIPYFPSNRTSRRIVVTTRVKEIAIHCSKKDENIYELRGLGHKNARDLLVDKVFPKDPTNLDEKYPELVEPGNLILKKCKGLPLAIVTIGGFLSNQPKTASEWKKLNDDLSVELEMNRELEAIRTILMKSYDGLPYRLKACFLYLSIFPEDLQIRCKRLLRRWIGEGYSNAVRNKSTESIAEVYLMQLISRSMLLPSEQSVYSGTKIQSVQVHDIIREIGISKSNEENHVLRLDEGCSSLGTQQTTARHLSINGNWQGGKNEFESMVDMPRVRSITVFGKWRPFFISEKMRMLRVLDLEDTTGLVGHHLEHVWQLLHLRYLSLRGCIDIYHLPDSLGNLRQLETLDVRGTLVVMIPKAVIKLEKLRHLHAGAKYKDTWRYGLYRNRSRLTMVPKLCAGCCFPRLHHIDGFNRHDACTFACCAIIPCMIRGLNQGGVMLPRGSRRLKALLTLRDVHLQPGADAALSEIKRLTGLRKLGVVGVTEENGPKVCSVISHLSQLESLSMRGRYSFLYLGDISSPPKNLQSLKLYGSMHEFPKWISQLQNLVKLNMSFHLPKPEHDAALQVLGHLPNLSILHIRPGCEDVGELNFKRGTFGCLSVLELEDLSSRSVMFEQGTMPKLEQLNYRDSGFDEIVFAGLQFLPSIKKVVVNFRFKYYDARNRGPEAVQLFKKQFQDQLALNPNADKIILKLDVHWRIVMSVDYGLSIL